MKKGFTLIETLIYLAILATVFVLFTNIILSVNRSYAVIGETQMLDSAAIIAMDRMTREVREATSVDSVNSIFNSNPGALSVNQVDQNNNTSNVIFRVNNRRLSMVRDGQNTGELLPLGVGVSSLVFVSINNASSKAVKIEMELTGNYGSVVKTQKYYSTVILRGSYKI
jgi:prepilin-type N-terminal cleavage/methylation domain-containing protein